MRRANMPNNVKLEGISGTAVINGVVQQSCDYSIFFSSIQQKVYSFSLFFVGGLSKPSFGGPRYWLSARLMDNITNSPSVSNPAPFNEFVGSFRLDEGDPRDPETELRYLNELNFRIYGAHDSVSLNVAGKTHRSIPDHLSNWEFDITVSLSEEMIQLLRSVPPIDHDA